MPVRTSACFCFALASFALVLPIRRRWLLKSPPEPWLQPVMPSKRAAKPARNVPSAWPASARSAVESGRDECRERQGARREYRRCPETRDCGGSHKEPASMTFIFPAG